MPNACGLVGTMMTNDPSYSMAIPQGPPTYSPSLAVNTEAMEVQSVGTAPAFDIDIDMQSEDAASHIADEEFATGTTLSIGDCELSQSEQSSPTSTSKSGSWKRPSSLSENFDAEDDSPDDCPAPPIAGQRHAFSRFGGPHPLSPSQFGKEGGLGSLIKGTFINFKVSPPSPAHGAFSRGAARIRAKSLPKDVGSPKSDFEVACHSLSYQHTPVKIVGSEDCKPTNHFNDILKKEILHHENAKEPENSMYGQQVLSRELSRPRYW